MSTINSRQHRFLQICVGLGCLGTLPFLVHPLGLERPDAWMFSTLNYLIPSFLLFRFQPSQQWDWSSKFWKNLLVAGLTCELIAIALLILSAQIDHLPIDWSFAGFQGWVEIQIGQQIERTQAPMPGLPIDFQELSVLIFWSSFAIPWFFWWGAIPQEAVWRGWVADGKPSSRDWYVLSTYWTCWQLPSWLLVQQWHWGWWRNNGELFLQQVISTWLLGVLLVAIKQRTHSIIISAVIVSILTISQVWPIMLQDFSPAPNWLWIGWNGWIGCLLMIGMIRWCKRNTT